MCFMSNEDIILSVMILINGNFIRLFQSQTKIFTFKPEAEKTNDSK